MQDLAKVNNPIPVSITNKIVKLIITHTVNCHNKASLEKFMTLHEGSGVTYRYKAAKYIAPATSAILIASSSLIVYLAIQYIKKNITITIIKYPAKYVAGLIVLLI